MVNVLVIGAHGKVGRIAASNLAAVGDNVFAGFRDSKQFESLPTENGLNPILFDLTKSVDDMAQIMKEYHIHKVVFTAGAGGKGGVERTTEIDLDGAVKAMEAAKATAVEQFVMVSAAGADNREVWLKAGIYTYYMMKHYADRLLQQSGLNYTILRPTVLSDEAGTGKIKLITDEQVKGSTVTRADVAQMIVEALHSPKAANRIVTFEQGDEAIQSVFA